MILQQRSERYTKAVTFNVTTPQFAGGPLLPSLTTRLPIPADTEQNSGFWKMGQGTVGPALIQLAPFAQAAAGSTFSAQVWGYWVGFEDPDATVAVPHLLCELACTVGDIPGPLLPYGTVATRQTLLDSERLCDQITVTKGWQGTALGLGPRGDLFSLGAGSGVAAVALVDPRGAAAVTFLFDYLADAPVPMNAFWTRAG